MRIKAVLIVLALALAACQQPAKPDPQAVQANRALYDQLRGGRTQDVMAQLAPDADTPAMEAALTKVRALIPAGNPTHATVVVDNTATAPAGRAQLVVVEYDHADRTARLETGFVEPRGTRGWKLRSFHLRVSTHEQLQPNTLSLAHRSPAQLAFFALAITSPLLMIAAFVKVLRTPNLTYRWLWAAFAFVGLFSFQMNWASGALLINWLALQIWGFWLAHGASKFEPWMIGATVPIGALLILSGLAAKPGPKA